MERTTDAAFPYREWLKYEQPDDSRGKGNRGCLMFQDTTVFSNYGEVRLS